MSNTFLLTPPPTSHIYTMFLHIYHHLHPIPYPMHAHTPPLTSHILCFYTFLHTPTPTYNIPCVYRYTCLHRYLHPTCHVYKFLHTLPPTPHIPHQRLHITYHVCLHTFLHHHHELMTHIFNSIPTPPLTPCFHMNLYIYTLTYIPHTIL